MNSADTKSHKKLCLPRWWQALLLGLIALVLGVIFFAGNLPYQAFVARQIEQQLRAYGIESPQLEVTRITTSQAGLANLRFGGDPGLTAKNISAEYQLDEVRRGYVRGLEIDGLSLHAYQQESDWLVSGLEPLLQQKEASSSEPLFTLPLPLNSWRAILPRKIAVHDSVFAINAKDWEIMLPASMEYSLNEAFNLALESEGMKVDAGALSLQTKTFSLSAEQKPEAPLTLTGQVESLSGGNGNMALSTGKITLDGSVMEGKAPQLTFEGKTLLLMLGSKGEQVAIAGLKLNGQLGDNEVIRGTLRADGVVATGFPAEIPRLSVSGDFIASVTELHANLHFKDNKGEVSGNLDLRVPQLDFSRATVKATDFRFRWEGGTVMLTTERIPLSGDVPIPLTVGFQSVSLAKLLAKVSSGKVEGTGSLTGSLPLIYAPDGSIQLKKGSARGTEEGTLSVAPGVLPENARQEVDLARQVLQDFHYETLGLELSVDENQKTKMLFTLHGNNPKVLSGKPINLNVTVTGDIIPLLQQSLLPFQDIRGFIAQEVKKK